MTLKCSLKSPPLANNNHSHLGSCDQNILYSDQVCKQLDKDLPKAEGGGDTSASLTTCVTVSSSLKG